VELAAARGQAGGRPGEGQAIVGRGAVNQKGPEMAFLAAVKAIQASGRKLPVNLVLVAEGEEEVASTNFHQVVAAPEVREALSKSIGVFIRRRRRARMAAPTSPSAQKARWNSSWWWAARRLTNTRKTTFIRRTTRGSRVRRGGW
jgi:hypothetical protein